MSDPFKIMLSAIFFTVLVLTMANRFPPIELIPARGEVVREEDVKLNQHLLRGAEFVINKTWDNKDIDHNPIKISMKWHFEKIPRRPHKRVIRVQMQAPLFDDPEPPNDGTGYVSNLYDFECIELFFMNEKGHYLEVEIGPHGHWLVLLFDGYRHCINNGENIDLEVTNQFDLDVWNCTAEIPLAYLPGEVTRFNAYAIHGSGQDRHYEALYPVTDGAVKQPDFHLKQYFQLFDIRRVVPEGYNRKAYTDMKYGNMWDSIENTE